MGLFDEQWLGIPPTGKLAFLRYVEFHRVAGDVICETAMFFDVLDLMHQAGVYPLPPQTGAQVVQPGPRTHDGLLFDAQDPQEGTRTLDLTNRMAADLVASDLHSDREELATTWHEDMLWFGPAGIGATFTIDRYERQHQGPFSGGLENFETELGSNLLDCRRELQRTDELVQLQYECEWWFYGAADVGKAYGDAGGGCI